MADNTHPAFTADARRDILNMESAAELLGVSTATARNWVKCGHLPSYNRKYFYRADVENIRSKILTGELKKLNKRANKLKSGRTFLPEECVKNRDQIDKLNQVISFIQKNNIETSTALFLLCLNFLKKERILLKNMTSFPLYRSKVCPRIGGHEQLKASIGDMSKKRKAVFTNKQIQEEINSWLLDIGAHNIKPHFSFLLECDLPKQKDILGIFYQSLLLEGRKSHGGSYYTPSRTVGNITADYVKKDSKALDPCCGTGQFLLAFADIINDPLNIYGIDCDKTAVRIARINILTRFKNRNFKPNIFCQSALFDAEGEDLLGFRKGKDPKNFDVIATNPPWGARFSKMEIRKLKSLYPQITSFESFSYFLEKSLDLLRPYGTVSFLLPESILNVKAHKDIRKIILKKAQIKKIIYLNRLFKNVFTPVIRLDLEKNSKKIRQTTVHNGNCAYKTRQIRWSENPDFVFDIHSNKFDSKIIDKIYQTRHITLKNNASWALGIVTGDNKRFISDQCSPDFEPVYRGGDVKKFILDTPSSYIKFQPEKFQQTAPEEKYRAREKLIYRFISKNLVFAYDNQKRLTLNSANILIPEIPDCPIKVIAALFNSSLYQFIFQKRFFSIKVLRSHIEDLPIPLWNRQTFSQIIKLVDKVLRNQDKFQELNDLIINKFSLTEKEKTHIKSIIPNLPTQPVLPEQSVISTQPVIPTESVIPTEPVIPAKAGISPT